MLRAILVTSALLAAPAYAQDIASGDPAAGEDVFNQCVACHVVVNDEGETLAGRNGKIGPNLYGVAMRTLGTYPDFNYGKAMVEAGEAGNVWNEENFVGYVQEPTDWLRETLDDKRARGKMAYKLRSEEDAANVYAYLVSIGPEIEAEQTEEGKASD
jgi:cytochrome c